VSGARRVLLGAGAAFVLVVLGRTAWMAGRSVELARRSEAFQQVSESAGPRMLIVGDSTAVGTGASGGQASLAGLLGRRFPAWRVENRGRDGATFTDLDAQLAGNERFDMVLVLAGGNDVIRMRGLDAMRADIERVTARVSRLAPMVVLMPAGNVGNAPFFLPPVSWLMTWRSRRLHRFVSSAAARHGASYVDLFEEREADPFVIDPALNACDGLHPSAAGYRVWFDALMAVPEVSRRLEGGAPEGVPGVALADRSLQRVRAG
jgi:lysophospholipase L1-like esterase